jgi:uroporphyrin-III C-methyltransferase
MIRTAPYPFIGLFTAFRAWGHEVRAKVPAPPRDRVRRKSGHVTLLGAGPGTADLITLRGLAALQSADIIYYDRLADPALLAFAKAGAICVSVGKAPGHHAVPQEDINARLVHSAQQGKVVVRLKCGDPGIFGRGAEEAAALTQHGIPWTIIPGVTAACAAAAAAGSFLTERGQTERVVFATGHRREGEANDWRGSAAPGTTLACYMGISTLVDLQSGLIAAGWPGSCTVEVVSKAQTPDERVLRGNLHGLARLCAGECNLNPAILIIRWPAPCSADRKNAAAHVPNVELAV